MPRGKPAGIPCIQLGPDMRCLIYTSPLRPSCCAGLRPEAEMCGETRDQALARIAALEAATRPECSR